MFTGGLIKGGGGNGPGKKTKQYNDTGGGQPQIQKKDTKEGERDGKRITRWRRVTSHGENKKVYKEQCLPRRKDKQGLCGRKKGGRFKT